MAMAPMLVFDRTVKQLQRDRAAHMLGPGPHTGPYPHEQLRDEIAWQVCDRVHDIARTFKTGLDLGCGRGHIGRHVDQVAAVLSFPLFFYSSSSFFFFFFLFF
jgi:NADH dehydrogenase [ubiquinone] 1 alpha subcomplex assembly factor 5